MYSQVPSLPSDLRTYSYSSYEPHISGPYIVDNKGTSQSSKPEGRRPNPFYTQHRP